MNIVVSIVFIPAAMDRYALGNVLSNGHFWANKNVSNAFTCAACNLGLLIRPQLHLKPERDECTPVHLVTVFMSIYARINVPAKLLWEKDRIGDRGDKSCIAGGEWTP